MKKSLIIISMLAFSLCSFANSTGEKIYEKLKAENKSSFSMSLSKNMIDFFDMDLDFNGKEKLITGDFHEGKMLVLKEVESLSKITSLFEKENYEKVEDKESNYEGNEAYLFIKRNGKNINEAHFVVKGEDSVTILTVYGDIKVKNK